MLPFVGIFLAEHFRRQNVDFEIVERLPKLLDGLAGDSGGHVGSDQAQLCSEPTRRSAKQAVECGRNALVGNLKIIEFLFIEFSKIIFSD